MCGYDSSSGESCSFRKEKEMPLEFYKIFKPLTANPFRHTVNYMEFEPCAALKPYIRCFWGARKPYSPAIRSVSPQKLVIPDTCMDIIFSVNYTENRIRNIFSGISDALILL